jgi:UDP-3-O-[3-hydroxymyristoyl] glucosamine N-acyltransferase
MIEASFMLSDLAEFVASIGLSSNVSVERDIALTGFSSIHDSEAGTVSWSRDADRDWGRVKAAVVIVSAGAAPPETTGIVFVPVNNPRLAFIRIMNRFLVREKLEGIAPTAVISSDCQIGEDVYIGDFVSIGKNVQIGDGTVIRSNVSIYSNVSIGARCVINSGVVMGVEGFGFERDGDEVVRFPNVAGIRIGDDVELGSNTAVECGGMYDTVIEDMVKIDQLCVVGHNTLIEEGCMLTAFAVLGGGVRLGKRVFVGLGVVFRDNVAVGEDAFVGAGAVVVKDVPPGITVIGNPARPMPGK